MPTPSGGPLPGQALFLSSDACAILDDYHRFLKDIWEQELSSPDAVLTDALSVLVARYPAFRAWRQQTGRDSRRSSHSRPRPPRPVAPAHVRGPRTVLPRRRRL